MERESKYRIPKIVVIFFSMVAYETFFPSLFYEYFAAAAIYPAAAPGQDHFHDFSFQAWPGRAKKRSSLLTYQVAV